MAGQTGARQSSTSLVALAGSDRFVEGGRGMMSGSPAAKATTQCNRLPAPPFRWCREFVAIYARLTACEVCPFGHT
jgi:hypothetical protein